LQLLRLEQGNEQIDEQADGQDAGEPEQGGHGVISSRIPGQSQPVEEADHRDRDPEQGDKQNQIEQIEHRASSASCKNK
jgi:hypothetical protein